MDKVYLIAELGINHEGDITKCARMIKEAKLVGADAVKLQTVNPDKSYLKTSPSYNIFKQSELTKEDTAKMFNYAKNLKIDIFTTVADEETASWVCKLGPSAWKISSGLLNHIPLISHLCSYKEPIYLSTGMAFTEDIDNAVEIVKKNKKKCTLFQCTSEYPLKDKNANLGAIHFFKEKYELEIGFSDHSIGNYLCSLAVAAGAKKIEKHFTFDKSRSNYDHAISSDINDFRSLLNDINKIQKIFGKIEKTRSEAILTARKNFLRYLVTSRDLKKGSIICFSDLEVRRVTPGEKGIEPCKIKEIIGRKLRVFKKKNQIITQEDILF